MTTGLVLIFAWTLAVMFIESFTRWIWYPRAWRTIVEKDGTRRCPFPFNLVYRQRNCERIPRWFGVAWYDPRRDCHICLPFPVNYLARWWRDGWFWVCLHIVNRLMRFR